VLSRRRACRVCCVEGGAPGHRPSRALVDSYARSLGLKACVAHRQRCDCWRVSRGPCPRAPRDLGTRKLQAAGVDSPQQPQRTTAPHSRVPSTTTYTSLMEGLRVCHRGSYVRSRPNFRWPQTLGSPPVGALPALGQVLSNWKGVVTSPMTPEELSALADSIRGIRARARQRALPRRRGSGRWAAGGRVERGERWRGCGS
jgi:hypothetical protein